MEIVWTELLSNSLPSAGDISTDILTAFLNIVFPNKITVKLLYREDRSHLIKRSTKEHRVMHRSNTPSRDFFSIFFPSFVLSSWKGSAFETEWVKEVKLALVALPISGKVWGVGPDWSPPDSGSSSYPSKSLPINHIRLSSVLRDRTWSIQRLLEAHKTCFCIDPVELHPSKCSSRY